MRVFANIVHSVTLAHACQFVEIHACTLTLYHAFACVFTKITFDWVVDNLDLIIDTTDKLLAKWRHGLSGTVHLDIVHQCQKLILGIFGFIGFDYDLNTLDDVDGKITTNNELTRALEDILDLVQKVLRVPNPIAMIYLKLSAQYRRAQAIAKEYCDRIIAHELAQSPESIAQRKRTSLIASLIYSLQQGEQVATEDKKKGQFVHLTTMFL